MVGLRGLGGWRVATPMVVAVMAFAAAGGRGQSLWSGPIDDRQGVVATETSGYGGPIMPMQGPTFFEPIACRWWYNYVQDSNRVFPGYCKLYMYWRATASYTAAQIQSHAQAAAAAYPGQTIWWAMSNEPNDRGQANQTAASFAPIYLLYHQNLKIGDPNCKIMGPGILNWDFQSTSVYQTGKSWYEEFRQTWYNNAAARAYSETNYGTSYPPQDGFNFHAYDLRGVQGTPWAAEDWRYCRDEILACYNDVLTYPEVREKKVWLTEFAALRSATMDDNVALTRQLVGWMREQPFMARWFWFTIHSDQYWADSNPPRLELLNDQGQPWSVGVLAHELGTLPPDVHVDATNAHYATDPVVPYVRAGMVAADAIADIGADHPQFGLVQGGTLVHDTMRGRQISVAAGQVVRKVSFQYTANYNNSTVVLVIDALPTRGTVRHAWTLDRYGGSSGSADIVFDNGDAIAAIGVGLLVRQDYAYPYATNEWWAEVKNLTLYTEPDQRGVPGDFDGDGDVDQEDFGFLQRCILGPAVPILDPACKAADLDNDLEVDPMDVALFVQCLGGPGVAGDRTCLDN